MPDQEFELRLDREPLLTQIRLSSDDAVRLVEIVAQLGGDPAWQQLSDEYVDAVTRMRPSAKLTFCNSSRSQKGIRHASASSPS